MVAGRADLAEGVGCAAAHHLVHGIEAGSTARSAAW
jgi:hypothetical protein